MRSIGDLVALDEDGRLDPQADAPVARVVVEPARRRLILAVRELRDLLAEHALGVVHPVVARRSSRCPRRSAGRDAGSGSLPSWQAASIAFMSPRFMVSVRTFSKIIRSRSSFSSPALVPAEAVVDLSLRVDVEGVGVDTGEGTAQVEDVRGHSGKAEMLAVTEDRHGNGDVGLCEAPRYGWLWTITSPSWTLPSSRCMKPRMYQGSEPMCIGVESDSQSSRPCGVEDARAEIFGLADDRGVAHAEEDAGHLFRDGVEAPPRTRSVMGSTSIRSRWAGPDACRARTPSRSCRGLKESGVSRPPSPPHLQTAAVRASADAPTSMTMFPKRSTCARSLVGSPWSSRTG